MTRFTETSYAPINRSAYRLAAEATDAYEAARAKVARFINARDADEVVFTKNATEALNVVPSRGAAPTSTPATWWCSPSSSTTPTSCRGTSSPSAPASSCAGSRSTTAASSTSAGSTPCSTAPGCSRSAP